MHDCQTGQTKRVSVSSSETQGDSDSYYGCSISGEGRCVGFDSQADNLVLDDTNGTTDVFINDLWATGTSPGGGSGPGAYPPAGTALGMRNPYAGYTPVRYAKGQMHCHYYNDTPHMCGTGSIFPSSLLASYGLLGYDFVCVTEHFHCTTRPLLPWPLYISYCEEVTADSKHMLALGIIHSGCTQASSGTGGDEGRYRPWDWLAPSNGLCEVEQTDCTTVRKRVNTIRNWGGMAVVAHPSFRWDKVFHADNTWSDDEIMGAQPDGISIYNSSAFSSAVDKWDSLLVRGEAAPSSGSGMPLFGITEDDFTPVVGNQGFGRTWVLAEIDSDTVTQDAVMSALRRGRFWSYKSSIAYPGKGPILHLTTDTGTDGKPFIRVTSDQTMDSFKFIRTKPHVCLSSLLVGAGTEAECPYTGDELYVRLEAKKGPITVYSQPIGIKWSWSSHGGPLMSTARGGGAATASVPDDIVFTCAQPEDLPPAMPPLGYIGRPYLVSTTSGVYPPDATFTLSYEGQDVTPYGTSNLAIYRWDSTTVAWVKLASTIDIGNALVTAPLTQAGLYTISAEVIGDTTAPTVTIHTPANGATLTGADVVGVQAYDSVGVLRTSFYLNDQEIGADSTSYDGVTCEFDFGKKTAGQYTLKVVAEDVSGNIGEASQTITISSSGVAPAVAITSPANGANVEGTVAVTGTCADDSLVAGVFVIVDGMPVGEATVTGGDWTYNLDTSSLANGPHTLSAQVMDEDQNMHGQGISVTVSGPTLGNLSQAKSLADGEGARLSGRVVTFGSPGSDGGFYVEELKRFAGIRVEGSAVPAQGDMVSISGVMSTIDGERAVVGADVLTMSSSNPVPDPLGISNMLLGGGPSGMQDGITNAFGLNNIGLLIKTFGRVTEIEQVQSPALPAWFRIDDGSGVNVKCLVPSGVTIDPNWRYVVVTGISSCEKVGEELHRLVRVRDSGDIVPL